MIPDVDPRLRRKPLGDAALRRFSPHRFVRNWKTVHAVRGIDLQVDAGEILGLVGANGAGKTTLVKMMAGIIHPTGGTIRILGYDPWDRDDRMRRQIATSVPRMTGLWLATSQIVCDGANVKKSWRM